jgi:Ca2+-binding RTX toxin-like protein
MAVTYGTDRADTISGTRDNDFLYGRSGNDTISGGDRRDYISGGSGNDLIKGDLGNDILTGDGGNDRFFFGRLHDADVIQDFRRSLGNDDLIVLGDGIDSYVITVEWSGIRIATIDQQWTADPVQGSIVLSGVSEQQWKAWGGRTGYYAYTPSFNPNPMIVFEDSAIV